MTRSINDTKRADGRRGFLPGTAQARARAAGLPAVRIGIVAFLLAVSLAGAAPASDVRVITNVESRDVYVGESFLMQITIDGSSEASEPDFSAADGFIVEYLGGSNNSSESISIINGRVQRQVHKGFVFTYKLTPQRQGRLLIPAVDIDVGGTVFKSDPVAISVKKPEESEDFKLRIALSRETCYVGEPVVLSVVWYLRRDVESFNFTAPVLDTGAFDFEVPEVKIDPAKKYFRIPIANGEVIAEKGEGMLDGESFVTLTFRLALIPRKAGRFDIPEFIVACESGTGIRSQRDFFNDFFSDNYNGRWRGTLKKFVVPSNALSLAVKNLPVEGRPEGFAGHVGELRISAKAEPVEVNVGDPITLSITLEGPDYLGKVELPPLSEQESITENFKVPDDMADGRIEGRKKIFTQTLRAKSADVTAIPPIRISYFDTQKGKYVIASSEPIPLTVHATRVVTAVDAEGITPASTGSPLEKWKEGIAYNYEGPHLLVSRETGMDAAASGRGGLILLVLPPLVFAGAAAARTAARRRSSDPAGARARGALKRLEKSVHALSGKKGLSEKEFSQEALELLKGYMGDRLGRSGASLTAAEAGVMLKNAGVEPDLAGLVREVFETCEMWAYAGHTGAGDSREKLLSGIREAARKLDKRI
ncbi:MAG: BatD family protein [Candidatus Krumholzibacteria bacterium]|nr:BatD family protein [Candidatus Krumholzibacteria bacterium]